MPRIPSTGYHPDALVPVGEEITLDDAVRVPFLVRCVDASDSGWAPEPVEVGREYVVEGLLEFDYKCVVRLKKDRSKMWLAKRFRKI